MVADGMFALADCGLVECLSKPILNLHYMPDRLKGWRRGVMGRQSRSGINIAEQKEQVTCAYQYLATIKLLGDTE